MLYLASQSPRRKALLSQLGIAPVLLRADPQEDLEALEQIVLGETPLQYVRRVTQAKGKAAWQRLKNQGLTPGPILVADTTVALGSQILGKPQDADDARRILQTLSGQKHVVYTCVVIQISANRRLQALSRSEVQFRPLSTTDIEQYVATGEPMDKAGAYGIQGGAARFVVRISGNYTGIIGLPLYETECLLQQLGLVAK
jgi:septum formation protein